MRVSVYHHSHNLIDILTACFSLCRYTGHFIFYQRKWDTELNDDCMVPGIPFVVFNGRAFNKYSFKAILFTKDFSWDLS
jgi:hypothetical protein